MITIITLFIVTPAQAEGLPGAASVIRPGQCSTERSLCKGHCKGVKNLSYTDSVEFGFKDGGLDRRLGNIAVVDGTGMGLGVYTADGPDANALPDFHSALPPRYTAWCSVDGLGPDTELETRKYATGTEHYTSQFLSVVLEIWGSYFAATGEPITAEGRPGKREVYTFARYNIIAIGG